jgi:hypothetical protein
MSETTNEPDEPGQPNESVEAPDTGLIADEQLPEDLQPEKNPLARNPGEESEDESSDADGSPQVDGMPDMGDAGATG